MTRPARLRLRPSRPVRGSLLLFADTAARQLSTFAILVLVARTQGAHAAGVVSVAASLSLLGFGHLGAGSERFADPGVHPAP